MTVAELTAELATCPATAEVRAYVLVDEVELIVDDMTIGYLDT